MFLSVRTSQTNSTARSKLKTVLTNVTTRTAACLQPSYVMEKRTVWTALMNPPVVWLFCPHIYVQLLALSHSCPVFQRTQMTLMQLPCQLLLVHLVPSDAHWAPNPAKTTLTVFTTTMSVMGRQTAEMAQMRKAAYQNVKVVSDLCRCVQSCSSIASLLKSTRRYFNGGKLNNSCGGAN